MDYGDILQRAWQIAWRHRVLWLFAFLAGLGMDYNLGRNLLDLLPPQWQRQAELFARGPYFVPVLALVLGMGLLVGLFLAWLRAVGEAALVDQVATLEDWGTPPSLRTGWRKGKHFAWRVFLIGLLTALPVLLVTIPATILALAPRLHDGLPQQVILPLLARLAPVMCLGILLAIPVTLLRILAIRACVLEDLGTWSSVTRAWDVIRSNLGQVLLFWLIITGILVGIIAAVMALFCPLSGLLVPLSQTGNGGPAVTAPFLCFGGLLVLPVALGGIIWSAFVSACWTLIYRQFATMERTGEEAPSPS